MIKKLIKGKRGGIGSIVALLVTIILVLGLISYSVLGQVEGVKDTGDKAGIEQQKINLMLQDPNIVTGNTIRSYASQASPAMTVKVKNSTDVDYASYNEVPSGLDVKDGGVYRMSKSYNENGILDEVSFEQVDLSR